jgi:hypothetical protein
MDTSRFISMQPPKEIPTNELQIIGSCDPESESLQIDFNQLPPDEDGGGIETKLDGK